MIALAWLAPWPAFAQDTPSQYLQRFDSNGDGCVSETEYVAYMGQGLRNMDSNGDGTIETDELPGARGQPITWQAYQRNLRRQFRKLDRKHDGCLNDRELTAPPD